MKILSFFIITALLSVTVLAESANSSSPDSRRHHPSPEKVVAHLTEELALSDTQASQILSILEAKKVEMKASSENRKEQRKAIHLAINEVLTEEQQQTFQELREKRREEHKRKKSQAASQS